MSVEIHTYYCDLAWMQPDFIVRRARETLRDVDFDTIAVMGVSGLLVGPMLARSMRKNLFVVRKLGDDSHHNERALGRIGDRWIFLDDFVSLGKTYRRVRKVVEDLSYVSGDERPELMGFYGYQMNEYRPWLGDSNFHERDLVEYRGEEYQVYLVAAADGSVTLYQPALGDEGQYPRHINPRELKLIRRYQVPPPK